MPVELQIALKGPKGEPVDLFRTVMSHGVADLRPGYVDEEARSYTTTLALPSVQARTIRIFEGGPGFGRVEVEGRKLGSKAIEDLMAAVRRILNLDEDLSEFYAPMWAEGMVAGRGWIALALVVFATWRPARVMLGAYLFGGVTIAQFFAQGAGIDVTAQLLSSLPYLATIVVLVIISRNVNTIRLNSPVSLGRAYRPD